MFCDLIVGYLLLMRMITTVTEMLDNCGHPTDFYFLRITNIGRIFLKLPSWLQIALFYASVRVISTYATLKRYKWVAGAVSVASTVMKWTSAHSLSAMAVSLSLLLGIAAALIWGWLGQVLGSPISPIGGDDDPIV